VATADPARIDLMHALEAPSAAHGLGTDTQGRDVWSRLVYGPRRSLPVGLASQGIAPRSAWRWGSLRDITGSGRTM